MDHAGGSAEGGSAEIKLADRTVVVHCLEIRESSVVVTIVGVEARSVEC
jgi:hypothetical protein